MGHAKVYLCTKFEVSRYSGSKFMKVGPKFTNLAPEPHNSLLWGYFVIRELGHATIYQCTIFEVSSFIISTFI